MKNERPNFLTADQIKLQRLSLTNKLNEIGDDAEFIRLQLLALDEIERLRSSERSGSVNLDWENFVAEVDRCDQQIAEILKLAQVERFDNPRCWLAFDDSQLTDDQRAVKNLFLKTELEKYTATKYGKPFRIRVR
jgi:hypothetical protein